MGEGEAGEGGGGGEVREGGVSRRQRWAEEQIAKGNCATCGKVRGRGKRFCDLHLKIDRMAARKRGEFKAWKVGRPGRPPLAKGSTGG